MKKNEVEIRRLKKLQLSRETLHILTSSDTQKVVGGGVESDVGGATSPSPSVCN